MHYKIGILGFACLLFALLSCGNNSDDSYQEEMDDLVMAEIEQAGEAVPLKSGFAIFTDQFPEQATPFTLNGPNVAAFADSTEIIQFIDPEHFEKQQAERESLENPDEEFLPLRYALLGKVPVIGNQEVLIFFQMLEGAGPNGDLFLALSNGKEIQDRIGFDVHKTLLENKREITLHSDKVSVAESGSVLTYSISEEGSFRIENQ